jgi:N-acetyl-gamma-glutamyl-phosphate reductase
VLGASGYAGRELCDLILGHPALTLAFATANDQRGTTVRIRGRDVTFVATEDAPLGSAELIFSALPHGASKIWVERALEAGARVVDLSADLRPGNGCEGVVYGLTELTRQRVGNANVVANPGCYPTSVLLALAPLAHAGVIAPDTPIIVNSASGVTGAGNSPKRELLFAEVAEDYRAYGVGNTHRHLAEMRATLRDWAVPADLVFTPHLLPVARGILSTITLGLTDTPRDVLEVWRSVYKSEPFVEIADSPPSLADVVRRNVARISATMLTGTRSPMLLVTSAIDNLLKGAASQAIQAFNVRHGLEEDAGLRYFGANP